MAGVKRTYEGMFLVDSSLASSNWDGVIGTLQNIFSRSSAEVINIRKWDDRRLMYEIKGKKRGTYILAYFKAEPGTITKIERDAQLNEDVLRILILKADQMTQEMMEMPTPIMVAEQGLPKPQAEVAPVEGAPAAAPLAGVREEFAEEEAES